MEPSWIEAIQTDNASVWQIGKHSIDCGQGNFSRTALFAKSRFSEWMLEAFNESMKLEAYAFACG